MSFSYEVVRTSRVEVLVGNNILPSLGPLLAQCGVRNKAVIITHDAVNELYGKAVQTSLESAGIKCIFVSIPAGETYKQWNTLARILPILQYEQLDRSSAIGSLGGGVAGDLAGYLASVYMRGLKLFHIPTTLLAQVDSALGGKTAVNYQQYKNIIGTYYQPCAIIADTDTLRSLPDREISSGMAEVIKTALLAGDDFFSYVERVVQNAGAARIDSSNLKALIERCLKFKSYIVTQDELDFNLRQQLNLGHTFGHAFEGAGGLTQYNHGEAVSLGLLCALRLSQLELGLDSHIEQRVKTLLEKLALPTNTTLGYEELAKHWQADKKRLSNQMRFIGLKKLGHYAQIDNPAPQSIAKALEAVRDFSVKKSI